MREIKFRAWDKDRETFIYELGKNLYVGIQEAIENTRFDVQQFTGLVDKSGKEIYEGDVVYRSFEGVFFIEKGNYVIEYHEEFASYYMRPLFKTLGSPGLNKHHIKETGLEIIGNIYEGSSDANKSKETV